MLYGDPDALESSLPATAVRKGQPLEAVFPEWCFLIRSYMMGLSALVKASQTSTVWAAFQHQLAQDSKRLEESLDNHAFAFSLEQHYGLPTMGLDLTNQLDTALFFALHWLEAVKGRQLRAVLITDSQPVLYLLLFPDRFCVEHARARPRGFPEGRPDRQHADPAGDYAPLSTVQSLFPDWRNDQLRQLDGGGPCPRMAESRSASLSDESVLGLASEFLLNDEMS